MVTFTAPSLYPLVETFHSLQGEGSWAGTSAFFIRLGGCTVHCPWCDQKETWPLQGYPQQSPQELGQLALIHRPQFVVITGGEPLLHNLSPLTTELHRLGLRCHLETSGAQPLTGEFDWITLSPKSYQPPRPDCYEHIQELKMVIAQTEDLEWAEAQSKRVGESIPRYLQPEWSNLDILPQVFDYILANPLWRLSLQIHKYLGVR